MNPFIIPEDKGIIHFKNIDEVMKKDYETHKSGMTLALKEKTNEKEIRKTKEFIKDFMRKIFKSDERLKESCKDDFLNYMKTSVGRNYFFSLLSKNKSNVILLEDKYFDILGELIYGTLIILKKEENENNIKLIKQLTESTQFFETNIKNTKKEKKSKNSLPEQAMTLRDKYLEEILKNIGHFNDVYYWSDWYNILLKKEKEKGNEVRKSVILKICDLMIECDLGREFISSTCEYLTKASIPQKGENGEAKSLNAIITGIINQINSKLNELKK